MSEANMDTSKPRALRKLAMQTMTFRRPVRSEIQPNNTAVMTLPMVKMSSAVACTGEACVAGTYRRSMMMNRRNVEIAVIDIVTRKRDRNAQKEIQLEIVEDS